MAELLDHSPFEREEDVDEHVCHAWDNGAMALGHSSAAQTSFGTLRGEKLTLVESEVWGNAGS